jgi:hypothetical protein
MQRQSQSILILLFSLWQLGVQPAWAQTENAELENQARIRQSLQHKALLALEEILQEVQSLKLPENRMRIRLAAAGVFWSRDQSRGRELFAQAASELGILAKEIEKIPNDAGRFEHHNLLNAFNSLRSELLTQISSRDPQLALDFLEFTGQLIPPKDTGRYPSYSDPEADLRFGLAAAMATQDPRPAVRLAQDNLERGLSYGAVNLFGQLMNQSPQEALTLGNALIGKLRSCDLRKDPNAVNVAISLLGMVPQSVPEDAGRSQSPDSPGRSFFMVGEPIFREALEAVARTALQWPADSRALTPQERDTGQALFTGLQSAMAQIEKLSPHQAASLRQRVQKFRSNLDPNARAWMEQQDLMRSGTVDDLLRLASSAPQEMQDSFFEQAVWKASGNGDYGLARQIAQDHIANPMQLRSVLNNLRRNSVMNASEEERLAILPRWLEELHSDEERVQALVQVAQQLPEARRLTAMQFLSEAKAMLQRRAQDPSQLGAQIQVAQAYGRLDPEPGFEIYEEVVSRLNELLAAAAVLDGFGCQRSFREGEAMAYAGSALIGSAEQCGYGLAALGEHHIARSMDIASGFDRPEVRLRVQLLVVQAILNSALPVSAP